MTPKQWNIIRTLFAEVRELPLEERETFLLSATNDEHIIEQVTSMLANDHEDDFLNEPALGCEFTLADSQSPEKGMQIPTNLISGFTIKKILGSGASGIVYEAIQENPHRRVAIKVLRDGAMGENDQARFHREAETLANLDHQNIATLHSVGTTKDGSPWMAMELVSGKQLDDWIVGKSTEEIIVVLQKISNALNAAHQQNIVHRDIKPANILVCDDNEPRVLDFGVARITNDNALVTQTGAVIGTKKYMSPEQAKGSSDVDQRCDVFALGIILLECLPQHVSKDLRTIASKATDEFPSRRYANAGEFGDDLHRWSLNIPVQARNATPWYIASLWVRRHSLASFFIVFAIAAITFTFSIFKDKDNIEYASNIQQAQLAYEQGDLEQMSASLKLCKQELRNWEWNWLEQLTTTSDVDIVVSDVAMDKYGLLLATTSKGILTSIHEDKILADLDNSCVKSLLSLDCNLWVTLQQDGAIYQYETSSPQKELHRINLPVPLKHVAAFSISANGRFVIIASVRPFDPADLSSLDANTNIIGIDLQEEEVFLDDYLSTRILDTDAAIAISNSGKVAVASLVNGGITIWRFGKVTDKREINISNSPSTVAIDSGDNMLAVAGLGAGVSNVKLLRVDTLGIIESLPVISHDRGIVSVSISPDNKTVASIDGGGILRVTPLTGEAPIVEPSQAREQSASIKFSEDGKNLLIRRDDGSVRVRTLQRKTNEFKVWNTPITNAWITSKKIIVLLADGSKSQLEFESNFVSNFLKDTDSLKTQSTTPDGLRLASISEQVGTIQIQDIRAKKVLLSFSWPSARIVKVGFIENGKTLLAISVDGRIKTWTTK